MADHATIISWLQEAGGHAFECEDPTVGALIQVDVLCHSATVGVRVRRGEQVEYRNISWKRAGASGSQSVAPSN